MLSSFQLLSFFSPNHHFKKKKNLEKKPNYSNTTYNIKDYICGCNRLIERLWVSKWSWIFRSFLSLLQTRCVFLLILVLFVIVFMLYYYVFIHVCKYDPWRKKVKYLFNLISIFSYQTHSIYFYMLVYIEVYLVIGLNNCKYRSNTHY